MAPLSVIIVKAFHDISVYIYMCISVLKPCMCSSLMLYKRFVNLIEIQLLVFAKKNLHHFIFDIHQKVVLIFTQVF